MNDSTKADNAGGISSEHVVTSGVPAKGPIDEVMKRTMPTTLANSPGGVMAAPMNPMVQAVAVQDRLRMHLDNLASAVEPDHGGSLTITDFIHLATNQRIQAKLSQLNLEKLIVALTGGPLNLKLAMELAASPRVTDAAEGVAMAEEYQQRLAGVLTGIESRNFAFMDDPATDERVRNCPTNKAAMMLLAEVESRAVWIDEMCKILGYDNSDGFHSEPDPHAIARMLVNEVAQTRIKIDEAKQQLGVAAGSDVSLQDAISGFLARVANSDSTARDLAELKKILWPDSASTLDQRDFVHAAETLKKNLADVIAERNELTTDLENVRRESRAYGDELAKYRSANDELTRQLDEATKPPAPGPKAKGGPR